MGNYYIYKKSDLFKVLSNLYIILFNVGEIITRDSLIIEVRIIQILNIKINIKYTINQL